MNSINKRLISNIGNSQCFHVNHAVPGQDQSSDNGVIVAPKMKAEGLYYLRLKRNSQSLVLLQDNQTNEIVISDIMGRYSLMKFLHETIKVFYNGYPMRRNHLGITYTEHLLRSLQWDITGETMIIGCAKLGWFLFRKENDIYQYISSFCGSGRLGYAGYINYADAIIRDFRAEKIFILNGGHVFFAGFHQEEHWYLYDLDLQKMKIESFYPIGHCYDVQYLPKAQQFLLFLSSEKHPMCSSDEDPHYIWNGEIAICDSTGQVLRTLQFDPSQCNNWFPNVPYTEYADSSVWYTDDEAVYSELYILNTRTDHIECFSFDRTADVYFDPVMHNCIILQKTREGFRIFKSDMAFQEVTPFAELKSETILPRIRYLGTTSDGMLLQIDHSVYCLTSDNIQIIVSGQVFEYYEPDPLIPHLFEYRTLMYGDYYNILRVLIDIKTLDFICAEPMRDTTTLLPKELFHANGLPDMNQINNWIRENAIPERTYYRPDEINAFWEHKNHRLPEVDRTLPPKEIGKVTDITGNEIIKLTKNGRR